MKINLLCLEEFPIYEQLKIEEALLRSSSENWCILNVGSPKSIVMGISSSPDEMLDVDRVRRDKIPVIRRFSGGGTVIVDEETLFTSFIFEKSAHTFPAYPEPILRWSEELFQQALGLSKFALLQNDFVLGHHKCGGNAQYLRKGRWLHHSTFLYDYNPDNMQYLLNPKRAPEYRKGRDHDAFLTRLRPHLKSKREFFDRIGNVLSDRYDVISQDLEGITLDPAARKSVSMLHL